MYIGNSHPNKCEVVFYCGWPGFFLKYFLLVFRGRGWGREREASISCHTHIIESQPGYVSWPRIEMAPPRCPGWHPNNWVTLARAWPGFKKQKHALVSEFFYKKKSYPKATWSLSEKLAVVNWRRERLVRDVCVFFWGGRGMEAGCSCMKVLSLGFFFPVLPHPEVPEVCLRDLEAQYKMFLAHGHWSHFPSEVLTGGGLA